MDLTAIVTLDTITMTAGYFAFHLRQIQAVISMHGPNFPS
jgi:hypothetical protein